MGVMLETPTGAFKNLIVDNVAKLEDSMAHFMPELPSNIAAPLCSILLIFLLDWRMGLAALVTIPLGTLFFAAMMRGYGPRMENYMRSANEMNSALVEYVNGIQVIKAFNQSSASYGKFVAAVRANRDAMKGWFRATNGYYVAGMAIAPASLITVLPAGVYFHMSGTLDAPAAITCFILSLGLIQPILQALGYTDSLAMMDSTLKEVSDLLGRPEWCALPTACRCAGMGSSLIRCRSPIRGRGGRSCRMCLSRSWKAA